MKDIRPFTKAVFDKEGKGIVGHRWTLQQVQRAYEIADELLDTISLRRKDKYVKRIGGLVNVPPNLFRAELRNDLMRLPDDEAVEKLGVSVLSHLLERGLDVAATATEMYNSLPAAYRKRCALSTETFFEDKHSQRKIPASSFEAFRTQENPAICQNKKWSQSYADLYTHPLPHGLSRGAAWEGLCMFGIPETSPDIKLFKETRWIQQQLNHEDIFRTPLDRSDLRAVVATRMGATRE